MILPHRHQMDGAFAARLRRTAMRTRRHTEPTFGAIRSAPWAAVRARPGPRRPHLRRGLRHLRLLDHARRLSAATSTRSPACSASRWSRRRPRSPTPASVAGRGGAPQPDDAARQRPVAGSAAGHGRAAQRDRAAGAERGSGAGHRARRRWGSRCPTPRRWWSRPGSGWDGWTRCAAAGPSPASSSPRGPRPATGGRAARAVDLVVSGPPGGGP